MGTFGVVMGPQNIVPLRCDELKSGPMVLRSGVSHSYEREDRDDSLGTARLLGTTALRRIYGSRRKTSEYRGDHVNHTQ